MAGQVENSINCLPTCSDPHLSTLTHPCNDQFKIFYSVVHYACFCACHVRKIFKHKFNNMEDVNIVFSKFNFLCHHQLTGSGRVGSGQYIACDKQCASHIRLAIWRVSSVTENGPVDISGMKRKTCSIFGKT